MKTEVYPHRFADVILNSDYAIRKEIDEVIRSITLPEAKRRFEADNAAKVAANKKPAKGLQSTINILFRERFAQLKDWDVEKNVFGDPENDLAIDFWKRDIGVDVAFVHRSFLGGDLLRLQAAAEVKNIVKVGVYVCPTKEFARSISPDGRSMVSYERALWYLTSFYSVLTVPILVIGITS
jgi:hypothetical protein